jgi:hypothetical protein
MAGTSLEIPGGEFRWRKAQQADRSMTISASFPRLFRRQCSVANRRSSQGRILCTPIPSGGSLITHPFGPGTGCQGQMVFTARTMMIDGPQSGRTSRYALVQMQQSAQPTAEGPALASGCLHQRKRGTGVCSEAITSLLSRLIEQHRRALCRGHPLARSRTSGWSRRRRTAAHHS